MFVTLSPSEHTSVRAVTGVLAVALVRHALHTLVQSAMRITDAADHRTAGCLVSVTGKPRASALLISRPPVQGSTHVSFLVSLEPNLSLPTSPAAVFLQPAPPSCPSATRLSLGQCPRLRAEGPRVLVMPLPFGRVLSFPAMGVLSEWERQSCLLHVARRANAAEADTSGEICFVFLICGSYLITLLTTFSSFHYPKNVSWKAFGAFSRKKNNQLS